MSLYGYIELQETKYKPLLDYEILTNVEDNSCLLDIYYAYTKYKQFPSVQPIFHGAFIDPRCEFVTYKVDSKVVAWTMIRKLDETVVDNMQFCWDYKKPKLALGHYSLIQELNWYKAQGYDHYYMCESTGSIDSYKTKYQGFEWYTGARWSNNTKRYIEQINTL